MIIALDGPAASGKGTLAKRLATHFRMPHLDTGLLYRAVGVLTHKQGLSFDNETAIAKVAQNLTPQDLEIDALRTAQAGDYASRVAVLPLVRAALFTFQQNFANQPQGAVLDGRDIGTVIAPFADVKFFVFASSEVRAKRRFLELDAKGLNPNYDELLQEIVARDERDANRANAPLVKADEAIALDTSFLSADEVFHEAIRIIALQSSSKSSSRDKR